VQENKITSHKSFLLSGGAFVALNFLSNLFEVGFGAVLVRLPEGDYSTAQSLFRVFFIITAPLASIQLMVGKEISALRALDRYGEAKHVALLSLRSVLLAGVSIMALGLAASPLIARFINIDSVLPVVYTMLVIAFYAPIPVLYGIIQGLKKFALLGLVNISWGGGRFVLALLVFSLFSQGLNGVMAAVVGAAVFTVLMASLPARDIFRVPTVIVGRPEIQRAFAFTLPIMLTLFCIAVLRGVDLVFAKRFFPKGVADAYSLAATVGSAFFTLSSIFMVMLPTISHEKTLQRNPIRFLLRSMLFTGGLSLLGIAVAWFFPTLVMQILTVGKIIPGAAPLIRIVGLAVLPLSISYLIANYFLAQHIAGFLPILLGGTALQILLIVLVHPTPMAMLYMVGIANVLTFAGMVWYLRKKHREYAAEG
jgi:O-antigen/teichoic acid export membrane protein